MLSVHARLLVAASLVLVAFLGLTGWALDRAFRDSTLEGVRERLQTHVYMLLGAADPGGEGGLSLPDALPEARLSSPGSGLYAEVTDAGGEPVWRSDSLLGLAVPFPEPAVPGRARFAAVTASDGTPLLALGFTVSWELAPGRYRQYSFGVAEARAGFDARVGGFRRSLWGWLLAAAAVLLAAQGAILRWSLAPLRRIARQVAEVEAGRRDRLTGPHPRELRRLADNLNALIRQSHAHLERHRNALGDLAHSLKTPLAVLRSAVEGRASSDELREAVAEQVMRMDRTVAYQLQRAAAAGRIALAAPVAVAPVARKLVDSLAKVYAGRGLRLDLEASEAPQFRGDEGDLMEILGNLADNACKWARTRVVVRARSAADDPAGVELEVEDDGPGIPADQVEAILRRGVRTDERVEGHGIGLAVVRELVEVYGGCLSVDRGALGGARVRVSLRF